MRQFLTAFLICGAIGSSAMAQPASDPAATADKSAVSINTSVPAGLGVTEPNPVKMRQMALLELPGRPGFDSALFANGRMLMAHYGDNTVDIFDPVKRRLVAQVTGIDGPRGMALDSASGLVFIACTGTPSITVLDSKTWKVQGVIGLKHAPESLTYLPEMKSLLVSNPLNRSVSLVSVESVGRKDAELNTIDVGGTPQGMAWDPMKKIAFVTVEDRSEVLAIAPAATGNPIQKRLSIWGSQPTGIIFEPASRQLFVAVRYAVLQLDADSGNELSRVPAAAGTDNLWLDHEGNTLYAAAGDGTVSIIRVGASRLDALHEFRSDVRGKALAYDASSRLLYLTGGREGKSKMVILKQNGVIPPETTEAAMKR